MFESMRSSDLVLSLLAGAIIGFMIAIKWRVPKSWWGFLVTLILNIISPWSLTTVWLVAILDFPKTIGSPFLLGVFTVINLMFIYRKSTTSRARVLQT